MQVKIVTEPKPEVKEMTVEELAGKEYIGMVVSNVKYMGVSKVMGYVAFVRPEGNWCTNVTKLGLLKEVSAATSLSLFVFDTAKELYLWMAE